MSSVLTMRMKASGGGRTVIGDCRALRGTFGRLEPFLQRLSFRAQVSRLGLRVPRGPSPFALLEPSRNAADDDARQQREEDDNEQWQRHRERRLLPQERIERDGHPLAVG